MTRATPLFPPQACRLHATGTLPGHLPDAHRTEVRNGSGVTMIDPHDELYAAVLGAVPQARERDTVAIDLADRTHAVGLNFLDMGEIDRSVQDGLAINELLAIAERLYDVPRRDSGVSLPVVVALAGRLRPRP